MRKPAIMVQATGSNAGKSTLVAGLCRAFTRRGLAVRPFKPQNMSNNAAATPDGGEIGRAQALQAMAAGIEPSVHMNPVLLKPESETGAQIIVQGKRWGTLVAREFGARKGELLPFVLESFARLEAEADLVIVEGAGSPAETNLRAGDIANMGFACAAGVPVILLGDIDRGGVIASLVGTHAVLEEAERAMIRAFAINKFRGDAALFAAGSTEIARRTGWPALGILPFFSEAARLPAEDALDLARPGTTGVRRMKIAVPVIQRIANFDDLDPLGQEEDVELVLIRPGEALPGDAALVILPGSKSTIGDLAFFREQGWDIDLAAHIRRGGHVLGLCGGFQMLGKAISDPQGIEGPAGSVAGLGLLDIETVLTPDKITRPIVACHLSSGAMVSAYEIHLGRSDGPDCARALFRLDGRDEGATSADGRVSGTYLHGLFTEDAFRRAWLAGFGVTAQNSYRAGIEDVLDRLADHCEAHLDLDAMLAIARSRQS
ncbi:MAG: cobyric acid synthase [Proteobacteria bacterium]|nr:cobyric acid synthase [Pseudomonadota bacterium]